MGAIDKAMGRAIVKRVRVRGKSVHIVRRDAGRVYNPKGAKY